MNKLAYLMIAVFVVSTCSSEPSPRKRTTKISTSPASDTADDDNRDSSDLKYVDQKQKNRFDEESLSSKENQDENFEKEKILTENKQTPIAVDPVKPIENNLPSGTLESLIGKPIKWNRGWEKNFQTPSLDSKVKLTLVSAGSHAIKYDQTSSAHWGQGPVSVKGLQLPGMAILLIDGGDFVYGGMFDWFVEPPNINAGWRDFNNIYASNSAWEAEWQAPTSGTNCWFLLMSWDKKYSSNPVSFTWP